MPSPIRGQPCQIFIFGLFCKRLLQAVMQSRQGLWVIPFCGRNRHLGQIVAEYVFGIDLIHRGLALSVTGRFLLQALPITL